MPSRPAFIAGVAISILMPMVSAQSLQAGSQAMSGATRSGPPAQEGSGVIRGTVTAAQSGAPLRRARVTVRSPALTSPRSAVTNEFGVYEVTGLPAGRYVVSVAKVPYATVEYGQRRALAAGTEVAVREGAVSDNIDIAMPRGSVIAGRVFDDLGEPAAYLPVMAFRSRYSEGRRTLIPVGRSAATDDIGQYRIAGLPPGSYYVRTTPPPAAAAFNMAPSYYPGTQDVGAAEPVTVGLGSEVAGVDFSIQPGGLAHVRGVVVDDRGQPARGARIALVGVSTGSSGSAAVRQDGSFALENVAPGDYHLAAMRTNPASGEQEMVQRALTVAGADIDGLSIVMGRGGSVSGVVVTDDGSVPEMAPASLRVRAVPLGGALPVRLASAGSGMLGPEWAFELTGVGGAFMLQVRPLPAGWMLKQVLHDGQDVSDTGLRISGTEAIDDVQMVITRRTTAISGAVVDGQDRPVADCTVIAFAEDRARWRPHSALLRHRATQPAGALRHQRPAPRVNTSWLLSIGSKTGPRRIRRCSNSCVRPRCGSCWAKASTARSRSR